FSRALFRSEKGYLTTGEYGGDSRMVGPNSADFSAPDPWLPRVAGENHYQNWIDACKGGEPACSNFSYACPFTEVVLLGNLAIRMETKVMWDGKNTKVTNIPEANVLLHIPYRPGWEL